MICYFDLETYCELPIAKGNHAYASHPSAEVLLFGYAIDDAPAKVWDVTKDAMPEDLRAALIEVSEGRATHVWQNGVMFDRVFLHYTHPELNLPLETMEDTMVLAYQAGLPGSLGELCSVFKLGEDKAKDKQGGRLINLFCKPAPKNYKVKRATRLTHPQEWVLFVNYCRLDIESMREVYKKLPKFNKTEKEKLLQITDARINMRGIPVDVEFARAAIETADRVRKEINRDVVELTDGVITSAAQRDAMLAYFCEAFGWNLGDMTKAELEKRLNDPEVPEPMRELIGLRLKGTKNSVQKYKRVVEGQVDGRLRGCMQFRGASRTGRVAGRLFQPQNLPRPSIKSQAEVERCIELTKEGLLDIVYEDPAEALSSCLRSVIVAPEGYKLCVADYSNVEGRVLAWLADEEWKLQAFRDVDAGHGTDLYKLTYARTFGVKPEEVSKGERQMGKVLELAMGYQGGPGAFATFARGYGMDLNDLAGITEQSIEPKYWIESQGQLEWAKKKGLVRGMSQKAWVACNAIKLAWRAANNQIAAYWDTVSDACVRALSARGTVQAAGKIRVYTKGAYLLLELPSGRRLCYPAARLPEEGEMADLTYMGVNQYSKKFERIKTYGGKLTENIVQAVACDLLLEAGPLIEAAGFQIVLSVHDEYIAIAPDTDEFSVNKLSELMVQLPPWAEGLPLVAPGYEAYRYRKD